MKKLFSVLLVIVLIFSISTVAFSAFDRAITEIEVKAGDTVVYTLNASGVSERVICADYSVYYDSDIFTCTAYSDTVEGSVVNKDLTGEVRGNWVNLNGIDYSKTAPIITVTLKANSDAKTNINYYMRDFCCDQNNEIVEIEKYEFTSTVKVNSDVVIENEPAELNVDKEQDIGGFNNSASGNSKDAGIVISENKSNVDYGQVAQDNQNDVNGGEVNENKVSDSDKNNNSKSTEAKSDSKNEETTKAQENATTIGKADDKSTNDIAVTNDQNNSKGPSVWLWIVIGLVVLGGGGAAGYVIFKNKKSAGESADASADNGVSNDSSTNDNSGNE